MSLSVPENTISTQKAVRVILVEDDESDARIVNDMLRDAGDRVRLICCDRLAAAEPPISRGLADLVLLDLGLPDASGLEALHRLRTIAPDVPVVVFSGLDDEEIAAEAISAGAQDVLVKGTVDADRLTRVMRFAVARQRSERRLARTALRDPLTGLPNRVLAADRLEQTLARGLRRAPHAPPGEAAGLVLLMLLDIDGFGSVSARVGHAAGDRVLVELAARLRGCLREGDTLARLGGDEFVILCEDVIDERSATRLADRLAATAARPSEAANGVSLSVTIGIAIVEPGEEDVQDLLLRADGAVRAAKRVGPGRSAFADPPAGRG